MTPERWQLLKNILGTALELPYAERALYLDEICGADAELRREAESLLAFENSVAVSAENSPGAAFLQNFNAADEAEDFINRQIGRYRLLREIGAGGMGVVFLAERTDGEFEQQVAVKLLQRSFHNSSARHKFQRERQILARLKHPYIAQLLDGGTTAENTPFLVMEYVEGTPITNYAEEKNLSIQEKLKLFRKVCAAVSFAHRNLIVHRDLKPDNILVTTDGTPKLLDFGIAKLISADDTKATVTRFQALTPEYASPEQIGGAAITTASDVYSLGVVLYELIVGGKPFDDSRAAAGYSQRHGEMQPLKPSEAATIRNKKQNINRGGAPGETVSGKKFRRQTIATAVLKGDVDNIILKALKKSPERRYQSVELFAEDIRLHLAGLPVTARSDTFFYRTEKFLKRNPFASAAVLLAFCSLLAGLFFSVYQMNIANIEREKAERRFKDVRHLTSSFIFEINEKIDESPIKARELLVARAIEYLDKLAAEAESDDSLHGEVAAAYEKIGDVQSQIFKPGMGNSQAALESQQKALRMREAIYRRGVSASASAANDLAKSYIKVGNALTTIGNIESAAENYRRAIAVGEQSRQSEPENAQTLRDLSRAYAMLGQAILRTGSLSEALGNYEKAISVINIAIEKNPGDLQIERNLSVYYSYAGYAKLEMGAGEEALRFFRDALKIEKRVQATDEHNTQFRANAAISELWVGVALRDTNQFDAGMEHLQKALAMQRQIYEADKANVGEQNGYADCLLEIGVSYRLKNRFEAAADAFRQAISNYQTVAAIDTHNIAVRRQIAFTQRHLADVLFEKNETNAALALYEQSLAVFQKSAAADPTNTDYRHDIAFCRLKMGEAFLRKKETASALAHFAAALPLFEELAAAAPENVKRRRDLLAARNHLENQQVFAANRKNRWK